MEGGEIFRVKKKEKFVVINLRLAATNGTSPGICLLSYFFLLCFFHIIVKCTNMLRNIL